MTDDDRRERGGAGDGVGDQGKPGSERPPQWSGSTKATGGWKKVAADVARNRWAHEGDDQRSRDEGMPRTGWSSRAPERGSRGSARAERGRGDGSRRQPERGRPRRDEGAPRRDESRHPGGGGRGARGAVGGPPVDPDATGSELDPSVQQELRSLPDSLAEKVASHLVMAGRLLHDDPDLARQHAQQAHDLAPRILAVREALAVAAYESGDYKVALREARTVRRMSGDESWLPLIADCERGLGQSDRALELLAEVRLDTLPDEIHAECLIVRCGARLDLGQPEAALAALETDLLRKGRKAVWAARLRTVYAETLSELGRTDEADRWLRLAVASDPTGESGAADLLAEWQGVAILDEDPESSAGPTPSLEDPGRRR